MEDWRIKDNKIICYNLYNKLYPYKADMGYINRQIARIKKKNNCTELEATEIYKKELKQEVAENGR